MVYGIDSIVLLINYQIIEIDFVFFEVEPVEMAFHASPGQIEDFGGYCLRYIDMLERLIL